MLAGRLGRWTFSSALLRIKCKKSKSVLSVACDGEGLGDTLSQQEMGAQVQCGGGHLVGGAGCACRKDRDEK